MSLHDTRQDYQRATLDDAALTLNPVQLLRDWLAEALSAVPQDGNAMMLSTVDAAGRPSSRIVLLRQIESPAMDGSSGSQAAPAGLLWYTNYDSRKGRELTQNAHAALLFYWPQLERQIRVEGLVERLPAATSDAYFLSRPVDSRIGALASNQSQPIENRRLLEEKFQSLKAQFTNQASVAAPPRPSNWGGYRLVPDYFEFWQGRPSRLHDRISFTHNPSSSSWASVRLQP